MCLLEHRAGYEQQAVSLIMGESLPKLMTFFPVSGLLGHPRLEIPFKESIRFMFHIGENGRNTAMKEQGEKRSKTRQN